MITWFSQPLLLSWDDEDHLQMTRNDSATSFGHVWGGQITGHNLLEGQTT
jgi:hypothetical protein